MFSRALWLDLHFIYPVSENQWVCDNYDNHMKLLNYFFSISLKQNKFLIQQQKLVNVFGGQFVFGFTD